MSLPAVLDKNDEDYDEDIAKEHEEWKKISPDLYEFILSKQEEWPVMSLQWIRGTGDLLCGNFTPEDTDENAEIFIVDAYKKADERSDWVKTSLDHQGDVNRTRVSSNGKICASINSEGVVHVFEINPLRALFELPHVHTDGGYGLSWSRDDPNKLATCADDGSIVIWHIESNKKKSKPICRTNLESGANEVLWSPLGINEVAVACEDGNVYMFKYSESEQKLESTMTLKASSTAVITAAFNPYALHMLATGDMDGTVAIWDLRSPENPLHTIAGHEGACNVLKWSPHVDGMFATAGEDRQLAIWDLTKLGQEQDPDEAEDAVPELLFQHAGCVGPIKDFDWHPEDPWVIATGDDANTIMLWKPSKAARGMAKLPKMPASFI